MKKILAKMDLSEIIAGGVCIGMILAFMMLVANYITGYSIFITAGLVLLVCIPALTLCGIMSILLIAERKLRKRRKEA